MYWDVAEVSPVGNRTLAVRFADGLTGTVRLDQAYCTGVFSPLLDENILELAAVQYGVVVWPNGLDLAPDTMYREIQQSPTQHYEVGQRQAMQELAAA
jgi:hypothetical protein